MSRLSIYTKLQEARVALQKMKLKKSGENSYSKFKYFELMDFIPQMNELFLNLKLASNFSIVNDEAVLLICDTEEETEPIKFTLPVKEAEVKGCTPVQNLGALNTYLKRYLYLNALEIVEADALDPIAGSSAICTNANATKTKRALAKEEPPADEDTDLILGIAELTTIKGITSYFNTYQCKVKDKSAFISAINARRTQIQKETKNDNSGD